LPEREIYRFSENNPESTPALGPFLPERNYCRPSENTPLPAQRIPGRGKNTPESILFYSGRARSSELYLAQVRLVE